MKKMYRLCYVLISKNPEQGDKFEERFYDFPAECLRAAKKIGEDFIDDENEGFRRGDFHQSKSAILREVKRKEEVPFLPPRIEFDVF